MSLVESRAECRIVVLNFNGRILLEECLPSILRSAQKSGHSCAITVLDNCSADDSEAVVKSRFRGVLFVKATANRVFCSYNEYLGKITEDFVILLNNDIKTDEDFIDPLIEVLKTHPDGFFSTPRALNFYNGEYEGSLSKMEFRFGLLWGTARFKGFEVKMKKPGYTLQCGFGCFRRNPFLELGGFDDLYLPGTVEDSDLCFRAWRAGWKGYYCPDSVVHHMGQATFRKHFGDAGIRRLNRRNLYLFIWKNIQSPLLLMAHFLWVPAHLVKYLFCGQKDFLLGFADALKRFPQAMKRRRKAAGQKFRLSERDVFKVSRSI